LLYNTRVPRIFQKHTFVILALLLAVLAPAEVESVRSCLGDGAVARLNCVHALFPAVEVEYEPSPETTSRPAGCTMGSGGTLDEVLYPAYWTAAQAFSAPDCHPVPMVSAPAAAVFLPAELVAYFMEQRGPPFRRLTLDAPSLRAPPIL
jgi:hypothetical protein